MNRTEDFQAILLENENEERKPLLVAEKSPFFTHFLSECYLMNTTLLQLNKEFTSLATKPDTFSFITAPGSLDALIEKVASLERGLDVCGASLSLLQAKLEEKKGALEPHQNDHGFFKSLFSAKESRPQPKEALLVEHCELVCKFLKGRMGRLTEKIELYKQRKQSRTSSTTIRQRHVSTMLPMTTTLSSLSSSTSTPVSTTDALQLQLQLENSQLTSQLFSDLATTETTILHIARLQSTLQSHLEMQHDLTCRLFEESEQVDGDLGKGNKYLKRAAQDSLIGRKILVLLMLGASIILLLLHYLKQ